MDRWNKRAVVPLPALALLFASALLAGCGDEEPITGPEVPVVPSYSIDDGTRDGLDGFYWLPPMVPAPTTNGAFDAGLTPRVEICELDDGCAAVVATFSMDEGGGSESVRVDEADEHYIVNWHTGRFDLDLDRAYRVRVLVEEPGQGSEVVLGYADVRLVRKARDLRGIDGDQYVGVVYGRTLPIKFRIETGIMDGVTVDPEDPSCEECCTTVLCPGMEPVVVESTGGQTTTTTFYGLAGQRVSILSEHLVSYCSTYTVRAPDGAEVVRAFTCGSYFTDLLVLEQDGLYQIEIAPHNDAVVHSRITVWEVPPDARAETGIDAGPAVAEVTTPAQNAFVTFEGGQDERISVLVQRSAGCATYALTAPDGESVWSRFNCGNPFSDLLVLPDAGVHTLFIDPHTTAVASYTAHIRGVPEDVEVHGTLDGPPVDLEIEAPAQNARVTFEGHDGDRISIHVARQFGCADYALRSPSGEVLWSRFRCGNPFSDLLVLSETGTWTLFIDPRLDGVGEASVTLRRVPPDAEGAAMIGGERVDLDITAPGQNASVRFEGAADQPVVVHSDRVSGGCARYTLLGPDSQVIGGINRVLRCGAFSATITLLGGGTHRLLIDPNSVWTGLTRTTISEP